MGNINWHPLSAKIKCPTDLISTKSFVYLALVSLTLNSEDLVALKQWIGYGKCSSYPFEGMNNKNASGPQQKGHTHAMLSYTIEC